MPSWKKLITSGSDASLNSLIVVNGITGSLFGTASYALTASSATSSSFSTSSSFANNARSASYALTSSFASTATSASFAVSSSRAVSSSFATSASFAINSTSASYSNTTDLLNGYVPASVQQINVGETSNGTYTYIVRAQELEQSKHTTINIYNNLNFT